MCECVREKKGRAQNVREISVAPADGTESLTVAKQWE